MSNNSSYQAAARTRKRGLLGNITDNLISGNGSISGGIGRGISDTFRAKVTGIKEKFDPLNIAKKLTGNVGAAILGRATGRSREDMEHFTGRSTRGKNAPAHQYTKTGPDLGELTKALYTKVSEGQRPKLRSGDSISNVLGKVYNLFLINSKADSDARDEDKQRKIDENELKEKQHKEILKALTGSGMAVPVKGKKEEGKSFLDMIRGFFGDIMDFFSDPEVLAVLNTLIKAAGPLLAIVGAGYVGYKFGDEFVKPLIDKMMQFHTGDKDATLGTAVYDKTEQFKKKFFGIETTEDKMNNQFFDDTINAATKNNNSIPQEVKEDLLSKDWVKNDKKKLTQLSQLTVIPKQNKSAIEVAGSQLPAEGKGTHNISDMKTNASTGVMTFKASRNRQTGDSTSTSGSITPSNTPTASVIPPQSSPIGARILDATTNNNDAKLNENTSPKMINIDNSKKMGVGGSAPSIGMDSSVSVRIDDPTLQKLQKQGLRPI